MIRKLMVLAVFAIASVPALADGPCGIGDWGASYYVTIANACSSNTYLVGCGGFLGDTVTSITLVKRSAWCYVA